MKATLFVYYSIAFLGSELEMALRLALCALGGVEFCEGGADREVGVADMCFTCSSAEHGTAAVTLALELLQKHNMKVSGYTTLLYEVYE